TKEGLQDPGKKLRNTFYRICGIGIISTLIITGLSIFILKIVPFAHFTYGMETIMLSFFGISWWIKGKGLVDVHLQKDKKQI
ncbi:unnamed protein product, partial [Chrysoparadoxa australica]